MRTVRESLNIFILSDMVQIKRGRKSIELMPLDEADEFGRDLCLAVAAARATQPIRHKRSAESEPDKPKPKPDKGRADIVKADHVKADKAMPTGASRSRSEPGNAIADNSRPDNSRSGDGRSGLTRSAKAAPGGGLSEEPRPAETKPKEA